MKSIKFIIAAIALVTCTSCLKSNFKDLDVFDDAEIISTYVYHRYADPTIKDPLSGADIIKQATFTVSNDFNSANGTVNITASIPANFPESELNKISINQIVVAVQISTAADIVPVGDSPALGTPADWSKPHTYEVQGAGGTTKKWTISLTLNK